MEVVDEFVAVEFEGASGTDVGCTVLCVSVVLETAILGNVLVTLGITVGDELVPNEPSGSTACVLCVRDRILLLEGFVAGAVVTGILVIFRCSDDAVLGNNKS